MNFWPDRWRISLSLRTKLFLLVLSTIALSVCLQGYYGASLILSDKESYLYQHNLNLLQSIGRTLEGRMARTASLAELIGDLLPSIEEAGSTGRLEQVYQMNAQEIGLTRLVFFTGDESGHVRAIREFGTRNQEFDPATLRKFLAETAAGTPGRMKVLSGSPRAFAIGKRLPSRDGSNLFFFASLSLDEKTLAETPHSPDLHLLDETGRIISSRAKQVKDLSPADRRRLLDAVADPTIDSGVKRWQFRGEEYIVCYQKLAQGKFLAVSFEPYETAFSAATLLLRRSVVVGFCIFLIAFGFSSIFIKSLSARIGQLWQATRQIADGDFGIRVALASSARDELSELAHSFNGMAQKIGELMDETAAKARMEKELETAQALQKGFFPHTNFSHTNARLAGKYHPSSECAGDWWGYFARDDRLVVVVGDVTGHGVSSALITAAAHGVFYHIFDDQNQAPPLEEVLLSLNHTIYDVAGGTATMTLLAVEIDLRTGTLAVYNAAHPAPLLVASALVPQVGAGSGVPLLSPPAPPLGAELEPDYECNSFRLKPGDTLCLYTDGFFEPRSSDGKKLSKRKFLDLILATERDVPQDPGQLCEKMIDATLQFGSRGAQGPQKIADDVTMVAVSIPLDAQFSGWDGEMGQAK